MTLAAQTTMTRRDVLAELEARIESSARGFVGRGRDFRTIRDDELYVDAGYGSFNDYLTGRWAALGGGRAYVYFLIAATGVMENLSTIVDVLPLTESHVRHLTKLSPEHQVVAWNRVLDAVGTAIEKITERLVRDIVDAYIRELRPAAEEGDEAGSLYYTVEAWNRLPETERARIIEAVPLTGKTKFNRTNDRVEWASWTWNPVTGCDHGCNYCYARELAGRYYTDLPEAERFTPVFRPSRLHAPRRMLVPPSYDPDDPKTLGEKNVFVCSMADLFGKWVPQEWIDAVFAEAVGAPDWNFLFLTKFPQRLAEQAWPENAWCGASVDRQARVATAERAFRDVKAGVRWLSCEPMLEPLTFSDLSMFDWVVIGGQSANSQVPEFQPEWEWADRLAHQAIDAGCKVYQKPNLRTRLREYPGSAP